MDRSRLVDHSGSAWCGSIKQLHTKGDLMLIIHLEDWTNGLSLSVHDNRDGYLIREVTETKLEALKALHNVILDLISRERQAILDGAMMQ